jgi:HD-like signal output (HDOD) protein
MDDTVLALFVTALCLPIIVGLVMYLHKGALNRQSRVTPLTDLNGVIGTARQRYETVPRRSPAQAGEREDIDALMGRLFVKQAVPDAYAGVRVDDIPGFVLKQLEKAIDDSSYIKNTRNILEKIDALETSTDELVKLVATDPMLAAALLRHANSVHYGVHDEVTSIRRAIDVVGLFNLKNLIYREYVLRDRKGKPMDDPALYYAIWEHALLCATAAAYLAPAFGGIEPAQAYLTALLHDIGKFLLLSSGFVDTGPGHCILPYRGGFTRNTEIIWKHDHALAGKVAALKWGLGPEVSSVIGMHHYPELVNLHQVKADPHILRRVTLLHVANQVAKFYSREARVANYVAPLHFSYHRMVDRDAVRAILGGSKLISELAKVKASMAFGDEA